jgi:hypothetical protein
MSDLRLFQISTGVATEVKFGTMALERFLQTLIEKNMEVLSGHRRHEEGHPQLLCVSTAQNFEGAEAYPLCRNCWST